LVDLDDHHTVTMNPSPLRRPRFVAALLAVATVAGFTLVAVTTGSASAAPDTPSFTKMLRTCDQTGCYVAWAVRDSDGDGVADADEIMAGTDPFDPKSRPGLTVVVELGLERRLPSFEAGRGAFVAFPAEIMAAIAKGSPDPLGAFPLNGRKDAMSRAGISADQIAKAGIDLTKDGLTLGLGGVSVAGPPLRIGGMDASLISAGSSSSHTGVGLEHGGVKSVTTTAGGTGTVTTYNDGATKTITPLKGGDVRDSRTTRTNSDGSDAGTATTRYQPTTKDGDVQVDKSNTTIYNPDDSLSAHVSVSVRTSPDGTVITTKDIVIYDRDDEGNITGITKVTEVNAAYPDGYASVGVAVEKCDAGGENCKTVSDDYTNNKPKEYLNPDADDTTIVTFDVVEQKLKLRGAAITVVPGWTAPGFEEDPQNPNDPTTIAFVDEEVGRPYLLVEPLRVTTAQPEVRGDLPNPYQDGGGCWPKCP